MWSDNETNSDFIDYQHLVNAITSIIDNDALLPSSIGVFGDWGSGKSSLMKMVAEQYKDNSDILPITFNGWLFEGYEDAKTVLMGKIVDEIIKKRTLEDKAVKIAAKLLKKVDLFKLSASAIKYGLGYATMGPLGIAAVSSSDALTKIKESDYEKYIKEKQSGLDTEDTLRSNIQEFHKNFEELIKETKIKKIIVFIDDLDRCSTDTIIGTLEAIKLFLFTKNTAFIIGADERLIKYAVRRRFPDIPGDNAEVGRDYLEKLIQYPIRIPPLSTIELTTYINLLFTNLYTDIGEFEYVRENVLKKKNENHFDFSLNIDNVGEFLNSVNENIKESLLLSAQIIPILGVGLNGNPRQCKRFLNTMLLRHQMAKSKGKELNKKMLSKLMLLEYFKGETFKNFYESQAKNKGQITNINMLEELATSKSSEKTGKNSASLTIEQEAYLQDDWLRNWFCLEPSLKGQDLQLYFYFSRDKLSVSGLYLQRMSSQAQDVYKKLLNDAESVVGVGLKESKGINSGDASAIFEALTEKIKSEDSHGGENSTLKKLCNFCEQRVELTSQLLVYLEKLPEQILPISITTWMTSATKNSESESNALKIIEKWSKSTSNDALAKICQKKLKKPAK